jgi:hypothetical protein
MPAKNKGAWGGRSYLLPPGTIPQCPECFRNLHREMQSLAGHEVSKLARQSAHDHERILSDQEQLRQSGQKGGMIPIPEDGLRRLHRGG